MFIKFLEKEFIKMTAQQYREFCRLIQIGENYRLREILKTSSEKIRVVWKSEFQIEVSEFDDQSEAEIFSGFISGEVIA
jgi:hypothetical protein